MKNSLIFFIVIGICSAFSSAADDSFVSVFDEPQIIQLNATLNKAKCNNKALLAINLPEGTKGLIYTVNVISRGESKKVKSKLIHQVKMHAQKYQPSKIVELIKPAETNKSFNLYLLPGIENAEAFYECGHYQYTEKHIDTKSRAGFIDEAQKETLLFGIEKSQDLQNLNLSIEVVAIM